MTENFMLDDDDVVEVVKPIGIIDFTQEVNVLDAECELIDGGNIFVDHDGTVHDNTIESELESDLRHALEIAFCELCSYPHKCADCGLTLHGKDAVDNIIDVLQSANLV